MLSIAELPFPNKGKETIMELVDDVVLENWIVPKGTMVKLWIDNNFGYVYLCEYTKDIHKNMIPRRMFRY